ncbi:rhodanese-like domain-containing protein [[Haemophilus] felis]|uniref:Rhodanese-like domain-containing protein n=1 Tax=[Haemophilus] felis TaxID=123822 RepID=A0A1T0B071_9PAST|nr:rhodanese-like domain-containing protein [[Haemophilus] felis]NBI41340.1 rhodanese-like domain-containing protein [[Haemophilus] felis]NBI43429.1 rhodanese-like domain-containing protein [[Haemophilus] felis]OOS03416.1 rhodanese-like domain-containing protein [[Haemophilus] felis]
MEEFIVMAKQFAQNHTLMVVAWVLVFLTVIYTLVKSVTTKVKVVTNPQATSLINNQDAVLLDIRSPDDFKQGHIVNSINILPAEIKKQNLGKIEQFKDKPVIVVCASGISATASAELLTKQGFNQVYTLKEGIAAWRAANLPLVKK